MKKYRENLESRQDQNIVSFVMMLCVFMILFSFYGAFSINQNQVSGEQNVEKLVVNQNI